MALIGTLVVRKISNLTTRDAVFLELLKHLHVVQTVTAILGPDVKLLNDQMLCKPGPLRFGQALPSRFTLLAHSTDGADDHVDRSGRCHPGKRLPALLARIAQERAAGARRAAGPPPASPRVGATCPSSPKKSPCPFRQAAPSVTIAWCCTKPSPTPPGTAGAGFRWFLCGPARSGQPETPLPSFIRLPVARIPAVSNLSIDIEPAFQARPSYAEQLGLAKRFCERYRGDLRFRQALQTDPEATLSAAGFPFQLQKNCARSMMAILRKAFTGGPAGAGSASGKTGLARNLAPRHATGFAGTGCLAATPGAALRLAAGTAQRRSHHSPAGRFRTIAWLFGGLLVLRSLGCKIAGSLAGHPGQPEALG